MGKNFENELTSLGYKKYVSESNRMFHSTDTLYQKDVVDDKGIRYYINIYYYPKIEQPMNLDETIQIEVQFHSNDDTTIMNVVLFEKDPRNAEMYLQYMWETLKLGYYELY